MKSIIIRFSAILFLLLSFASGNKLLSQTEGEFIFSVLTSSTGEYSPRHLIAIWIENNSSSFVKTKIKYSSNDNLDHLGSWTSKSSSNVVDAITGSTLMTHGTISFIWNGTDIAGNVVPDGTYKVLLEMAYTYDPSGTIVTSYSFVKGPNSFSSTPADVTNFKSVSLTWTPSTATLIENSMQNDAIRVFPNPTTGILNIDFKQAVASCNVQVTNDAGIMVFKENIANIPVGIQTFNLSLLTPGVYFVTLHMPANDVSFRIIIMK